MNSNDKTCNIPLTELEKDFSTRWSSPNNAMGPIYNSVSTIRQNEIDSEFDSVCSPEIAKLHIKKMNIDSAPGPNGILVRWIKCTLKKSKVIIAYILTYMIKYNFVSLFMHEAQTILIYKIGEVSASKNWRPITVSSVIRRSVENILDKELRNYIILNENQRGFTNQAGTLINTALVHECLQKAKREKQDSTVIFCDITQAFDSVGHAHTFRQILSKPAPTLLKELACSLASKNFTRINTKEGKTGVIRFERGVMQGSPLSPFLFNVSIDPMVQDLSETEVTDKFGFKLHSLHPSISNAEFADDTTLIGNSRNSAIKLYQQSFAALAQMGLQMSPPKTFGISIVKGELCEDPLQVDSNTLIRCIGSQETIKYLGVTFTDCIIFDEGKSAKKFRDQIEKLVSTPMLRSDQKIKVLKDYIWPTLVYPFQNAPLAKLSTKFLESIDQIICTSAKEIINLPTSTPTNMLYSSTKVKGLGLIRAKWEAGIQSFNAAEILLQSQHTLLNEIKDFELDQRNFFDFLDIASEITDSIFSARGKKSKLIRDHLRSLEYDNWCKLPQKGQGVIQFAECPQANTWIHSKRGLSSSEWTTALKMVGNVLPINAIPRPDQGSFRCRHSSSETETLGHILGKCPRGDLIRNNRHHAVRRLIADAMKISGWKVLQEVECTGDGSRRVEIIAYNQRSRKGFILDPTVSMEQNDTQQAEAVNKEKKGIYDPCIPYFQQKLGLYEIEVIGLYVGARGTITNFFLDFMKSQALTAFLIEDIVTTVLNKSVQICQHHLCSAVPKI